MRLGESFDEGRRSIIAWSIGWEAALAVVALLLGFVTGVWPFAEWRADSWSLGWGLLSTLPMLGLLALVFTWSWGPLVRLRRDSIALLGPHFAACSVLELLAIAGMAGFSEELLFRGFLHPLASRWVAQSWVANLLVSVLFAACHGLSRAYFLLALLVSLYLGFLMEASRSLLVPMLVHGLYDFAAFIVVLSAYRRSRSHW
jgi:membrane protease YdiL (CAAX protease family)